MINIIFIGLAITIVLLLITLGLAIQMNKIIKKDKSINK